MLIYRLPIFTFGQVIIQFNCRRASELKSQYLSQHLGLSYAYEFILLNTETKNAYRFLCYCNS